MSPVETLKIDRARSLEEPRVAAHDKAEQMFEHFSMEAPFLVFMIDNPVHKELLKKTNAEIGNEPDVTGNVLLGAMALGETRVIFALNGQERTVVTGAHTGEIDANGLTVGYYGGLAVGGSVYQNDKDEPSMVMYTLTDNIS